MSEGFAARTVAPFGRRAAEVLANEALGGYQLVSVLDSDGPLPRPGQFYMLATERGWGGDGERPYLPRAFSHARAREDGRLDFLLEAVGPGTARLGGVEAGERLLLVGPLGVGFDAPPGGAGQAVLVGGGIGAAPILCLSDEVDGDVLLGFRSAGYAAAATLFRREPAIATDDGSAGRHGLVTELLREALDADPPLRGAGGGATVYACGPPPMLEAVRALCAERDVAAQLALESGMACGYGACFGCVVPTRSGYVRLCVDGPVLDAGELESAMVPGAGHA